MKRPTLSALIIARNEEAMLANCIATLRWCNQILVLDDGSTDDTAKIAEQSGAKVIAFRHNSFARKREELLKRAQSDWVFYIDADERVVPLTRNDGGCRNRKRTPSVRRSNIGRRWQWRWACS